MVMMLMVIVVLVVTNCGAGGEGGGDAGDTSLLYTSPRVDRDLGDVQQGEHRLHQPWHHLLHHHS